MLQCKNICSRLISEKLLVVVETSLQPLKKRREEHPKKEMIHLFNCQSTYA